MTQSDLRIVGVLIDTTHGKNVILQIDLLQGLLVGRNSACDEVFPHDFISGYHFRVYAIQFDTSSTPLVYCQDTSLNGTFLNGYLIGRGKSVLLSHGDKISMCERINFTYYQHSNATETPKSELTYLTGLEIDGFKISNRIIGSGSFGEVRMAFDVETHQHFACKISKLITKKKNFEPEQEARILKNLNHPNIIRVYSTATFNNHILIFEDLLTGGDLFSYLIKSTETLHALSEAESLIIVFQILQALQYLHSRGIAHRDLKLDNIMLKNSSIGSRIVLGDFGISKEVKNNTRFNTVIGTPEYCAPEVGFGLQKETKPGYTTKCDMWSLGVITHLLLTGISPFYDEQDSMKTAQNARNGKLYLNTKEWSKITNEGKSFVASLLKVNPVERPSADECLKHRWIDKHRNSLEIVYEKKCLS